MQTNGDKTENLSFLTPGCLMCLISAPWDTWPLGRGTSSEYGDTSFFRDSKYIIIVYSITVNVSSKNPVATIKPCGMHDGQYRLVAESEVLR